MANPESRVYNKTFHTINVHIHQGERMKKSFLAIVFLILISLAGSSIKSEAGVDIVLSLPAIRFYTAPELVVIPDTYVYIIPGIGIDILFYEGYWWRQNNGHWYRSRTHNGRWSHVDHRRIPHGLRSLPHDNRHRLSPKYERVHYKEVQSNWKRWENEKHWDRRSEQRQDDRRNQKNDRYDDRRQDQNNNNNHNPKKYDDQHHGKRN
jgi:hypothetical protein